MYQVYNDEDWDAEYYQQLMEGRIISSSEAKKIRDDLAHAGALPYLDNNFDWAMLCISYCFAKGWAYDPNRLISATDSRGTEIPSFKTCFQNHAKLWLAVLSDGLFTCFPERKCSKQDLDKYIRDLWHTGAVELERSWQGCKRFKPDSDLEARQVFINELASLATKNTQKINVLSQAANQGANHGSDAVCNRLEDALRSANIPMKSLQFNTAGVRYDIYRLSLGRYLDLEKKHAELCSSLGVPENELHLAPCHDGEAHTFLLKLLRPEGEWHNLGQPEFKQALAQYRGNATLPVCIGANENGEAVFGDLAVAPHVLVGGATHSGKSACMRTLLHSLFALNRGKIEVAIIDPKKIDYNNTFDDEPDLWGGRVLDDWDEMYSFLEDSVAEMEQRYQMMKGYGVKNLAQLPENVRPRYRVIMVDELADLLDNCSDAEEPLISLAQKARASGIHLILSTQRPDAETLKGRLRSNLPSRIALSVQKSTESKIILDDIGAEKLLGRGDHLVKWGNGNIDFLHGYNL